MKSSLCSDEIFGVSPQMKLNPSHLSRRSRISSRSDFTHHRWIYPARKDGFNWKTDKSKLVGFSGLPERIWTFDLQSRSLTRYPAVPRAEIEPCILYHNSFWISTKKEKIPKNLSKKVLFLRILGYIEAYSVILGAKYLKKREEKPYFFQKSSWQAPSLVL